ncbi:MAG: hypothetical protein JNL66_08645 [Alphaproteobacteria bacterium]|nr:hypothetical protein [Alphaproteobacteria bacterium]
MTACRAERRRRKAAALVAALVLAVCAGGAPAQVGPPIRLGPPSAPAPEGGKPEGNSTIAPPPPSGPLRLDEPVERAPAPTLAPAPEPDTPPPVQAAPEPAAPGTPAAPVRPPARPAEAAPRGPLDTLIGQIPVRQASPAARTLLRRGLMGAADQQGDAASVARATRLLATGDVTAALDAGRRAGPGAEERVRLDVLLLNNDTAAACPLAREQAAQSEDAAWQRALIYCQILDNEPGLAELGLSMLPDGGTPEDAVFAQTALALIGNRRPNVGALRDASPLLLAMLRGARVALPASLLDTASPAVLAALAGSTATPPAQRLVAADRAELYGALDTRALLQIYDGVGFTARENTNLSEVADSDRGPRGRAALYRLVKAAGDDNARAAALQRLWRTGRERGFLPQAVRIGMPTLTAIGPSPALADFARDAVRALLLAGNADLAARWLTVASRDDADALWPLLRIAGAERTRRAADEGIGAWQRALAPRDAGFARTRLDIVRALIAATDAIADANARRSSLRDFAAEGEGLAALRAAATAGRRSETALQAVRVLGANPGPNAVATVVRALGAVGFVAEARAVALEAAVAAGL